ncbi:MAG: hypothetical protein WC285_03830 [Candidatus Gracilibacteria bacterium]
MDVAGDFWGSCFVNFAPDDLLISFLQFVVPIETALALRVPFLPGDFLRVLSLWLRFLIFHHHGFRFRIQCGKTCQHSPHRLFVTEVASKFSEILFELQEHRHHFFIHLDVPTCLDFSAKLFAELLKRWFAHPIIGKGSNGLTCKGGVLVFQLSL